MAPWARSEQTSTTRNGATRMHLPDKSDSRSSSAQPQPPCLPSSQLLRGGRRVVIEHGEARYTLLLTRNDKLILVK